MTVVWVAKQLGAKSAGVSQRNSPARCRIPQCALCATPRKVFARRTVCVGWTFSIWLSRVRKRDVFASDVSALSIAYLDKVVRSSGAGSMLNTRAMTAAARMARDPRPADRGCEHLGVGRRGEKGLRGGGGEEGRGRGGGAARVVERAASALCCGRWSKPRMADVTDGDASHERIRILSSMLEKMLKSGHV